MRSPNDPIQDYVQELIAPPSLALRKIEQELKKDGKWGINIGSLEGSYLQFLIKAFSVRRILEVGTQYGYSTQWMLEALPASQGQIITLELSKEHYERARSFINDPRVEFLNGDALELIDSLSAESAFDLIFIDANKKAYPEYFAKCKKLLKKGGLLVGDNTFLFGSVYSQDESLAAPALRSAMRDFNQQIFSDSDFVASLVPTREGLTVAYKLR